ncbi:hypothetical protein SS50377_25444 [Spironucleus salmonicida]|uniref:Uncharacterized protein n=1 Tax=Spironucleus salmonicida TaxID=348837 RepID=V6LKA8_9EUKA|nr:hypothetical protein SS50377_25444 [Spironucleus salmonicida]|eukprot:EST44992.1 Hypothetical protein SS50377_15011 [Spironucleus salmonicida]
MQRLSESMDILLKAFLQTDFGGELTPVLSKYEESFQRQQREEFAIDFYPTLYSEFLPIMVIDQPVQQYYPPVNIKQNLSLQNKLKVQRPQSHKSKVIKKFTQVEFKLNESELDEGQNYPMYPSMTQQKNYMPLNRIQMKNTLPLPLVQPDRQLEKSTNYDVEFDFDEIEAGTIFLQKFCKMYFIKCNYHKQKQSALFIQRLFKVFNQRNQFLKILYDKTAENQEQGILSQQNGCKTVMQISSEIKIRNTACQKFFTEIFAYTIPKNQFFFPIEMSDLYSVFWENKFEKQIISSLNISESKPELEPVSNVLKLKFNFHVDPLIDYFLVLSPTVDAFRESYRSTDVSPVLSTLSLASGSMAGSLVILCRNEVKIAYPQQLLHITAPICIINVLEEYDNIQNLSLNEVDTLQLFLSNEKAQTKFRKFKNTLFLQRKNFKNRYVQLGMLTSNFYTFNPIIQQKQIKIFSEKFKIPLLFNDPIQTNSLYLEIQDYLAQNSEFFKQIEINDSDQLQQNEQRVLVRGHGFPDLLQLSHSSIDSYLVQVKKVTKISREMSSQLPTGKKSKRVLTMSGLRARVASKDQQKAIQQSEPDRDIQIEVYDGDFFIDEQSVESIKIMGDLPVTNFNNEELNTIITIQMKALLPIKDVDLIDDNINERVTKHILNKISYDQLTIRNPQNYRLMSLNMELFKYKIRQEIITQKTIEKQIFGKKETAIINFKSLDQFQPHVPDQFENEIYEQVEEIIEEKLSYTSSLVIFIENNNNSDILITYITSSQDIIERKHSIPFRSHGWVFPAPISIFSDLKAAAIPIINLLVKDNFCGYATIQFLVGPKIEPFNVLFGINQHLLQFLSIQKICSLRFDQITGMIQQLDKFGVSTKNIDQKSILCIDICHELIRRSNIQQLKNLVLSKFAFDNIDKIGWLYDWADDIFAINVGNNLDIQKQEANNLVKTVLKVLHAQFSNAVTSISQGVDRFKQMSYQQIRNVEMGSNCIGILKSLEISNNKK